MTTLFQTGLLPSFLNGLFHGDCTFATLQKKGDFGLGTVNGLTGEMVAVDGVFYRMDSEGGAHVLPPHERTPFAVVTMFKKVKGFEIKDVKNLTALSKLLTSHFDTENIPYVIRIDGQMSEMKLRSLNCPHHLYPNLSKVLAKSQTPFELKSSKGTLVITYFPNYLATVTIPGFHYHYIDEQRRRGGHVFNLQVDCASVMIKPLRHFELVLNNTPEFDKAVLKVDIEGELKKVE